MHFIRHTTQLTLIALLLLGLAQMHGVATAQVSPDSQAGRQQVKRAELITQKLDLLMKLMERPSGRQRIEASSNQEAKRYLADAIRLTQDAAQMLGKGDMVEAERVTNKALSLFSKSSALAGGARVRSTERTRYAELLNGIRTFREVLIARSNSGEATTGIGRLDALVGQSKELIADSRYAEANKLLSRAYLEAVTSVSDTQKSNTVIYALNFETPADEYRYELNRYKGHIALVVVFRDKARLNKTRIAMLKKLLLRGKALYSEAERQAGDAEFELAIKSMERATQQLVRALRILGLPLPG